MLVDLDISDQLIVQIGGGTVAAGRVARFISDGARVLVIAPELDSELAVLVANRRVKWHQRKFEDNDLNGDMVMISVAIDDVQEDARIKELARQKTVLLASANGGGAVRQVAQRQAGDYRIAVDSGGKAPGNSVYLVEQLAAHCRSLVEQDDLRSQRGG